MDFLSKTTVMVALCAGACSTIQPNECSQSEVTVGMGEQYGLWSGEDLLSDRDGVEVFASWDTTATPDTVSAVSEMLFIDLTGEPTASLLSVECGAVQETLLARSAFAMTNTAADLHATGTLTVQVNVGSGTETTATWIGEILDMGDEQKALLPEAVSVSDLQLLARDWAGTGAVSDVAIQEPHLLNDDLGAAPVYWYAPEVAFNAR